MSRWKAASIHLSISIAVGLLVFALLFLIWFPQPYFNAAGGQHLILVLLGVDLVLGPMLTLILFKSGKKGMLFDLCLIGIVQSAALVYGMHVISQARPVFIVAAIDRFNVVAASELDSADLAEGSRPEFQTLSWTGPRLVAVRMPTDPVERSRLVDSGIAGKDIQVFPKYYVDYASERPTLLSHAKELSVLRSTSPASLPMINDWLARHGKSESDIVWVPVVARTASLTMLLDAKTGDVLEALPTDPW